MCIVVLMCACVCVLARRVSQMSSSGTLSTYFEMGIGSFNDLGLTNQGRLSDYQVPEILLILTPQIVLPCLVV